MTRAEYELLREQEPQLQLAPYYLMDDKPHYQRFIHGMTREELISKSVAWILVEETPPLQP